MYNALQIFYYIKGRRTRHPEAQVGAKYAEIVDAICNYNDTATLASVWSFMHNLPAMQTLAAECGGFDKAAYRLQIEAQRWGKSENDSEQAES